jgi:hypothetical protein
MVQPIRLFVGRQNIRGSDDSSAAELGRILQEDLNAVIGDLKEFIDHMEGVTPDILVEVLEPTFGKALEYCPVDSGDLRASGYLEVEEYRGNPVAYMGFGRGGKPDYTIYVHEVPAHHEPPTRTKWFQSALDEDYFGIINSLPRLVAEAAGM